MDDTTVFDMAQLASNDNNPLIDDPEDAPRKQLPKPFKGDELPVEVSAEKERARALLEQLGVGASVSMSMACANAGLPIDSGWRGKLSEPMMVWLPPRLPPEPRKRIAANDNEPQSWPLLEALRRDGKEEDISTVRRYRMLCEAVAASPYGVDAGMGADGEDGVNVEARSSKLSGDNFEKSFKKMTATKLPGGEISYHEQRRTAKQIISTGRRLNRLSEDTPAIYQSSPLSMSFTEGDRLSQIDGRPVLALIRYMLDVDPFDDGVTLLPLFDDAVLGGATLTFIGGTLKFKHKARSREAKQRIYQAIDIVRLWWQLIDERRVDMEEECHKRVIARRAELAAQRAAYLGIAA